MIRLDTLTPEQRDRAAEYGLAALAWFDSKDDGEAKVRTYFGTKMRLKEALGLPIAPIRQPDGAIR